MDIDPKFNVFLFDLAQIHFRHNNLQKAKACLKKYIESNSGSYEAHALLGDCYRMMGLDGAAVSRYEKALQIKSDYEKAIRGLEMIQHPLNNSVITGHA